MSPRSCRLKNRVSSQVDQVHGLQASRGKWRNILSQKKHGVTQMRPDRPHQSWRKPSGLPKHNPHSNPHGDVLGPHTNQPSPIRFQTRINRKGIRD